MYRIFLIAFVVTLSPQISSSENVPGFTDPATGTEFVFVKEVCYQMGDNSDEDNPAHEVCVNDFYMSKYEVTRAQWKAITGSYPEFLGDCGDDCPAQQVSWDEAQDFISVVSKKTGKQYRLPTEAEWEYAARSGGKNEKWAGTNSKSELENYAWYNESSDGKVHTVGRKRPNGLGLYDMSGNVWEWVQDWYDKKYYKSGPKNNPSGPSSGTSHVLRGGAWNKNSMFTTTSVRNRIVPGACTLDYYGFRLAMTP